MHSDGGGMAASTLCIELFSILRGGGVDDDIQMELLDIIGYGNMELVSTLLSNRRAIVDTIMANSDVDPSETKQRRRHNVKDFGPQEIGPKRPIYGAQVTITTEAEKNRLKQMRKEMRRKPKMSAGEVDRSTSAKILGLDGIEMKRVREQQLLKAASAPAFSNPQMTRDAVKYPHVYETTKTSPMAGFGARLVLPIGSNREDYKEYEEITIPVAKVSPPVTGEKLVPITHFEPWAQTAFKGYKSLNRVQSLIYPIAFETNENMLVCAPTGAGKTDVAMLTVLRTISQFREGNFVKKNDFKIIYVAPMKALAAEVVRKFSGRLAALDVAVRELTGDMQLTKAEIAATQMIVTTPEKWDVVTRKSVGDTELVQKVKLLIIDEVHLLHEDRGSVIESIVARTLRQVETTQSLIRIVGLSATLPNYVDVAQFLGVNPYQGLFYFDAGFRPVPLEQHFIGVKGRAGSSLVRSNMDRVCYDKLIELVKEGHQVMVFVHSRKDTVRTAMMLRDEAANEGALSLFDPSTHTEYASALKEVAKSRNKEMKELFSSGFGIHNAGMLRSDRNLTERNFEKGLLKVLCCTATLAWGVNLPAYAVIIKGTQLYDAQKGSFIDLSILDVLQIFGRAGRPQFEDRGVGFILTTHDKLSHYVSAMTLQHPIESRFAESLVDNLNAEVAVGTVTNVEEAIRWLGYTYLFVRMRKNPFNYGLDWKVIEEDPNLGKRLGELVKIAARALHKAQMIVFDERTNYLTAKDLGRTASSFYIRTASIEIFNEMMRAQMTEADVLSMVSMSSEFENIKVREEEIPELKTLERNQCYCDVKGGTDTSYGKTNILLQTYLSRGNINDFALVSDCAYVAQNAARILRALFEISLSRNWGPVASVIHSLCKSVDRRMWAFEHPLSQFDIPHDILEKLNRAAKSLTIAELREMDAKEIGAVIRHMKMGSTVYKCVEQFPTLILEPEIAPVTRTVLRITLHITADFFWNDRIHGMVEPFWIWVEDSENVEILHSEYFLLNKKQVNQPQKLVFTIPIPRSSSTVDELPPQIFARAVSDKWIGSETVVTISFKHLILPSLQRTPHTDLLSLQPLPVSALQDPILEEICKQRFDYFNPVQTQIFHTLYHTQHNTLIGAPTGSGKTVAAELAMWAAFRDMPKSKVVYIAPLKALVRERVHDWRTRVAPYMGRKLVELTGDITPDLLTIQTADIIITTPEKWDGISRSWQTRSYVTDVSLVIIDEIHLLGSDRGPILEVIVSRMNYISSQTERKVRIVGLSTALANANDLADWLQIKEVGLFNFRHSVRPVPLEIYIDGFPGKHYCPRMMSMNKPTYSAIMTHSPTKPVIVFVSSRRQTRLTAQDLMSLCAMDDNPKRFLHMPEGDLESILSTIRDPALKLSLQFGMGLHHAGLVEGDRKVSEELFVNGKIQILIATSTLAWGVNYPAHLVVIKGTEYYDAKTKGYVDFPITDVLQMMGRAGRPQFDDSGVARILVQDVKKNFFKKFLHEPFPVESSLHTCLHVHMNAEIVGGTIKSKQDAVDYLTWTYFYRRLQMNPTYYGVEDISPEGINLFMSQLVDKTVEDLVNASCAEVTGEFFIEPTVFGKLASFYYLTHRTVGLLVRRLTEGYRPVGDSEKGERPDGDFAHLLRILADVPEYEEIPVRHNEDKSNMDLEAELPVPVLILWKPGMKLFGGYPEFFAFDSPHVKTFLLLQAHLSRLPSLPSSDYHTDTTTVLDSSIRIMQAMIDVASDQSHLATCLGVMTMMGSLKQARWPGDPSVLTLPFLDYDHLPHLQVGSENLTSLRQLRGFDESEVTSILAKARNPPLSRHQMQEAASVAAGLPWADVEAKVVGGSERHGRIELQTGKEYEVQVRIRRLRPARSKDWRVHSPKFPKPQHEGWFVVLGVPASDDVLALRRVSPSSGRIGGGAAAGTGGGGSAYNLSTTLKFMTPDASGDGDYVVYVVSDGYVDVVESVQLQLRFWSKGDEQII
ncbi:Sec63 Brl domain-containing protein [Zopfochytrium polystomum]|nr:Sec63 Brl domain-containing protein [Zopfochytrium polystomum]